jgi:hypothetical protein
MREQFLQAPSLWFPLRKTIENIHYNKDDQAQNSCKRSPKQWRTDETMGRITRKTEYIEEKYIIELN